MSIAYENYLNEHIGNVEKGLEWFKENLPAVVREYKSSSENYLDHDDSKYSEDEYKAYDDYFYGKSKSYAVVQRFNLAWLHHIHNNPHHWQHWVLVNDDPEEGTVALEMPDRYILEMICDWWAFSWKKGNLMEIFKWYDGHKDYIIFHKNTRTKVEYILKELKKKLEDDDESR